MDQPRIMMCAPDFYGIEYEINPWMNRHVASDSRVALGQWRSLRDTLESLAVRVEVLDPVAGLPDLVFTANAGLIYRNQFLSSRFRFGVRRGETPVFEKWARQSGFEVVSLPDGFLFEGAGDALFCGDTLFAGYRFRSDVRSHHWVANRIGVEVLAMELVDPRFYHLDTCFCPLTEGEALYYPGAFDEYGRSVLQDRIPRLIEVSADEAVSFSCNAVAVGRNVLLNAGAPKIARALDAAGYAVHPLSLTEFIKSGGSAKCLTLRLDGEEAASWKHRAPVVGAA